jgi:hypothetical protein
MTIRRSAAFVTAIVLVAACSSSKAATPSVSVTQPPVVTISSNVPLTAGTKYSLAPTVLQRTLGFTATETSKQAIVTPGFVGIAADANGAQPLIAFMDLSNSRVFRDPLADLSTFSNGGDVINATDPVPADFLAYIAKLPGMTAGAVSATTFLGVPAKAMTYKVDSTDGGFRCGKDDASPCLLALFVTTGPIIALHKGDSGTIYDLQISGRRLIAEVTDRAGAADLVKAFTFGA